MDGSYLMKGDEVPSPLEMRLYQTVGQRLLAAGLEVDAVVAFCGITAAVGETIQELGSIPSGHLYAQLVGSMTLNNYLFIISFLKQADLVKESNHLLTWIGSKEVC